MNEEVTASVRAARLLWAESLAGLKACLGSKMQRRVIFCSESEICPRNLGLFLREIGF